MLNELKNLLKKDDRLVNKEGELLKNEINELAIKMDKDLIKLLLSDERMKKVFFVDLDGTLIFDKDKFIKFVSNKQFLPDTYTAFENRIGLRDSDGFIKDKKEVVLSWAYKDCILEGDMAKNNKERNEIPLNETLAIDEITRLLDPKVFTNAKRIDKDGEHKFDGFRTDDKGNIKDNLIIRGNNLLVLHSLKKRFAGKIKLIYIDPPYNTGNDEFKYNDRFNHSTWLTFMKNRLEVAKDLLRDDGIIYISIDHHENHTLKQLCMEIFKEENFIQEVTVKTATPTGFKIVNPGPVKVTEQILIFAKNKQKYHDKEKEIFVKDKYDKEYSNLIVNIEEDYTRWKVTNFKDFVIKQIGLEKIEKLKKEYPEYPELAEFVLNKELSKLSIKYADRLFSTKKPHNPAPALKKVIEKSKKVPKSFFRYKKQDGSYYYIINGRLLAFYSSKIKKIDGELTPAKHLTNLWTDISWSAVDKEGGVKLPNGKKPEKLLRRIIEMSTEPGDIVLDFFLGSGTTCAVAHKMGRQYIGVEQLDYGENDSVTRLKNVINGDPTGISKEVGWKGGGEFVYLEVMKWNENYVEKIKKAKTKDELKELWETMKEKAFLSYKVDIKLIDKNAKEFEDLSIDNQKRFLLECLDKNHLYVNYSEIDDEEYKVSEADKKLNKMFYGD